MHPLHETARQRLGAPAHFVNWWLILGVGVALVLGTLLGRSSLVDAQPIPQSQPDPSFFPATGYSITTPAMLEYFTQRGGVRTLGYPISNDFPLLGRRVQIFQRQMLELRPNGTVGAANILGPELLPVAQIDGLTLPAVNSEMVAAAPRPTDPEYLTQALEFVRANVPDEWNGLPVNFQTTYLESVSCADVFGDEPCDPSQLAVYALELWGLPTSQPTLDPMNHEFVYQRFERGIMHYSAASGAAQGLLVGDWLKRALIGVNLPSSVGSDIRGARVYAQYSPTRPLGLSRPDELPDTSLAQAFRSETLAIAQQPDPTLPPSVAQTATSVALTATAITSTQAALTGTQLVQTSTAVALTSTAQIGIPTQGMFPPSRPTQVLVPATVVSEIPVNPDGCIGDEQMWFVPRRPFIGTHAEISVTSRRHHDVRAMRLVGPLDSGIPTERLSPLGFVWTWTVVPTVENFYEWTFYADGLRPCMSSGFNAYAPLGATATPTSTREPTETPGTSTATPTSTAVPVPVLSAVAPTGGLACNTLVTITGSNFGSPPSNFGTTAFLFQGTNTTALSQFGTGSNTQLRVSMPSFGIVPGPAQIMVSNSGGDSALATVNFATGCNQTLGSPTT